VAGTGAPAVGRSVEEAARAAEAPARAAKASQSDAVVTAAATAAPVE
jgi:hypothetical protein